MTVTIGGTVITDGGSLVFAETPNDYRPMEEIVAPSFVSQALTVDDFAVIDLGDYKYASQYLLTSVERFEDPDWVPIPGAELSTTWQARPEDVGYLIRFGYQIRNQISRVEGFLTQDAPIGEAVPDLPATFLDANWTAAYATTATPSGRRIITRAASPTDPAGWELRVYSGPVDGGNSADDQTRKLNAPESFTTTGSVPLDAPCYNVLFWKRLSDGFRFVASAVPSTKTLASWNDVVGVPPPPDPDPDPPPPDPGPDPGIVTRQIISWDGASVSLQTAKPTGFYVDGNPFVIGSCVVTGYTPGPGFEGSRVINGAMKNIVSNRLGAFDSMISDKGYYTDSLNVGRNIASSPVPLVPGDALVIAQSNPAADTLKGQFPLKRVRIITCVASAPAPESFRPSFFKDVTKFNKSWANVNTSSLASLTPLAGVPTWAAIESRLKVKYPHFDIIDIWEHEWCTPTDHLSNFGRGLSISTGIAFAMCNCNYTIAQKKRTIQFLIQMGFDAFGMKESREQVRGSIWNGEGGWNQGRIFPMVFAGKLLGIDAMLNVTQRFGKTQWEFNSPQEFMMTKYVDQTVINATNSAQWKPSYVNNPHQKYSQSMLGMPDFMVPANPLSQDAHLEGHDYRWLNHCSYWGTGLSILAMGLRTAWDRPAFLDCLIRCNRVFNGKSDPWRTLLGYGSIGGWDSIHDYPGWKKFFNDAWPYAMFTQYAYNYAPYNQAPYNNPT